MEPRALDGEVGLTRRALLLGGGAAALTLLAGGAIAARELPLRSWWNRVSGACGDAGAFPPASGSPTRTSTFRSAVLGADVGYALAVPPFALAAVDGGSSYWHPRASGENRMAMFIQEFIPMCAERWRMGRERRAVVGWSMGGYGALLAAELYPGTFDAVAAASPAIYRTFEEVQAAGGDEFDSAQDLAHYDVFAKVDTLLGVDVRIDCGTADPFYANDRVFAQALVEPPAGTFFKGCHDADSWRVVAPGQIDFLGIALSRAS
jgi:S-formylglutathione hydrolase FrmB